jgi:hypothetical protein
MEQTHKFRTLIAAAIAFSKDGWLEAEKTSEDFSEAMNLIATKKARLELRISFAPLPSVRGELIRDEDGECIGHLFEHTARYEAGH